MIAFKKQLFLYTLISLLLLCSSCKEQTSIEQKLDQDQKPNIILLLVDDMGYGDLTCYGGQAVHTPEIDKLAHAGMRFTRFYSASAVCSPSRAAILTGRYPLRFNITRHLRDLEDEYLPVTNAEIQNLLKNQGYKTAHIGKWHLGGLRKEDVEARNHSKEADPGPMQHGFDHMLTNIEGAPERPVLIRERKLYREGGKYLVRNDTFAPEDTSHWTNIKVDEAIRFVDQSLAEGQPFFINLWFDVPHTPYEPAPEPHLTRWKSLGATGDQLYFRSMVSNLDENIGRLIDYLKQEGLYENTLIIFTSDNGAAWEGEVGPFKGGKTDLHEGGIRVPFFATWPKQIEAAAISFQRGHHVDILPTIAEAAGVDIQSMELDGISLMPNLLEHQIIERQTLFWQMDLYGNLQRHYPKPIPYSTVIAYQGPWKLLLNRNQPLELFHLENDPHEVDNQIDDQQELVLEMKEQVSIFLQEPAIISSPGLIRK